MLPFVTHLFLWITMIAIMTCEPLDVLDNSFTFDKHLLDEDPEYFYNKTSALKFGIQRNNPTAGNLRMSRIPPPVIPFPSTLRYPALSPVEGNDVDAASHPSVSRGFYTPPLPKNQLHFPFVDKSTLRGSNSENAPPNKRPIAPPPPSLPKSERERIPIKRPDIVVPVDTKKKMINTPSFQKLPADGFHYSEPSSTSSTTRRVNDTYDAVIPVVHNISATSVLRILHNGNKHNYFPTNKPRLEAPSKMYKEDAMRSVTSTTTYKPTSTTTTTTTTVRSSDEVQRWKESSSVFVYPNGGISQPSIQRKIIVKEPRITDIKNEYGVPVRSFHESNEVNTMPEPPEPRTRFILGVAWDIHVYLIATLFAILACISAFSLVRVNAFKWLLPYGYFLAVHGLLIAIGAVRSVYLFYDAYNISKSFSEPISRLMLNVVFPFLVCIFSLMFLFILKIVDLKTDLYYAKKSNIFILLAVVYVLVSVCIDLYPDFTSFKPNLILLSQCLFVMLCVVLGVAYIAFYKYANRSSIRKQNSVYGTAFTDPLRPSLAHAIRVMLATSLLSLLMAAIQLIGMFCIYDPFSKDQPHPWLWWAFQLSVRVIEVSICFLIFWAAVQPLRSEDEKETQSHNSASGFPLFAWGASGTPRGSDHGANGADDIYPAMCASPPNQTVHDYTLRSGKRIYEEIFPYGNVAGQTGSHSHSVTPIPTHLSSHTTDRRSLRRHQHPYEMTAVGVEDGCVKLGGYPPPSSESTPQPSPSMLIDEKGIVRFRSIADAEPLAQNSFPSTLHHEHPNDNYCSS